MTSSSPLPFDHLTAQELVKLQAAWAQLEKLVHEQRSSGQASGVVLRVNLSPAVNGGPALVRGTHFTVDWEG